MLVILYLLLVAACFICLCIKKKKWLTWMVSIILFALTVLFVILCKTQEIIIPSLHKSEIIALSKDGILDDLLNKAINSEREINFEQYAYKIKEGKLKFNRNILDEAEDIYYWDNTVYYRAYTITNNSDVSSFIPKVLFQNTADFYSPYVFYPDIEYVSPLGDSSKYPLETPSRHIKSCSIGDEITLYYLPSVIQLYDFDWFMMFGILPGVSYDSICAIVQGEKIIVFFENSQSKNTEIVKAIDLLASPEQDENPNKTLIDSN